MRSKALERLRRWLWRSEVSFRLSEAEALRIAKDAAKAEGHDHQSLKMTIKRSDDGVRRWIVREAAVGAVLEVEVDDSTGQAMLVRRFHAR